MVTSLSLYPVTAEVLFRRNYCEFLLWKPSLALILGAGAEVGVPPSLQLADGAELSLKREGLAEEPRGVSLPHATAALAVVVKSAKLSVCPESHLLP